MYYVIATITASLVRVLSNGVAFWPRNFRTPSQSNRPWYRSQFMTMAELLIILSWCRAFLVTGNRNVHTEVLAHPSAAGAE